jgi:glycosyltransferase involved in cell wall biosynthesis
MKKLAIITTHPIQYYAPIFQLLYQRQIIDVKVFYTLGQQDGIQHDPGFDKAISWDIPLLQGYPFEWAANTSPKPGTRSFKGIVTPALHIQITNYNPDALLVFGWAYRSHLDILRRFHQRTPVFFRGDSTLLTGKSTLKKILKYFFLKWVYSHIDHAFYVGKNNKAYFLNYGLKPGQLSFAPHAVDNERFSSNREKEASELRTSLGLDSNDILILFAGKFEPVKNVSLLLSAFISLYRPNVHLLLVGNGIEEPAIREQAGTSPHPANIHLMDFKNQSYMPVLYQAADLFCLPSKSETWGLSINEAMSCGKAILASDKVGCAADLVHNGINGARFREGDLEDLSDQLERLTGDREVLQNLGQHSRSIIQDWTFQRIAEAIECRMLNPDSK